MTIIINEEDTLVAFAAMGGNSDGTGGVEHSRLVSYFEGFGLNPPSIMTDRNGAVNLEGFKKAFDLEIFQQHAAPISSTKMSREKTVMTNLEMKATSPRDGNQSVNGVIPNGSSPRTSKSGNNKRGLRTSTKGKYHHIHIDSTYYSKPVATEKVKPRALTLLTAPKPENRTPLRKLKGREKLNAAAMIIQRFMKWMLVVRGKMINGMPNPDNAIGHLMVTIIAAKDLLAADGFRSSAWATSDPYIKMTLYGNLPKETTVKYKTINPIWNQTIKFFIFSLVRQIEIQIFDKDWGGTDELIGKASFPIDKLPRDKTTKFAITLDLPKSRRDNNKQSLLFLAMRTDGFGLQDGSGPYPSSITVLDNSFTVVDTPSVLRSPRSTKLPPLLQSLTSVNFASNDFSGHFDTSISLDLPLESPRFNLSSPRFGSPRSSMTRSPRSSKIISQPISPEPSYIKNNSYVSTSQSQMEVKKPKASSTFKNLKKNKSESILNLIPSVDSKRYSMLPFSQTKGSTPSKTVNNSTFKITRPITPDEGGKWNVVEESIVDFTKTEEFPFQINQTENYLNATYWNGMRNCLN